MSIDLSYDLSVLIFTVCLISFVIVIIASRKKIKRNEEYIKNRENVK